VVGTSWFDPVGARSSMSSGRSSRLFGCRGCSTAGSWGSVLANLDKNDQWHSYAGPGGVRSLSLMYACMHAHDFDAIVYANAGE